VNFILGLKVLYVEDQEYNRQNMRGMLERERMNVFMAANGREGLEKYTKTKEKQFNLIITDLSMPIMRYRLPIIEAY
jgi:CheY-like chemotaxis protein